MKTELEIYRDKIDEIDTKIIELYEARMEVVKNVIDYKIKNNIPILDSSRESKMLDKNLSKIKNNIPIVDSSRESKMLNKNLSKIKNHEYKTYYKDVLEGFLKASKSMQADILKNK